MRHRPDLLPGWLSVPTAAQGAVEEHHARIMFVARHYFIADTSSKGVFVADDTSPLGPGASAQLSAGDRLRIGPYRIVVEQVPGASAAAPHRLLAEPARPAPRWARDREPDPNLAGLMPTRGDGRP